MIPDVGDLGGDVFDDLMKGGRCVLLSLDVLDHDGRMHDAAQLRMAGALVTMTDNVVSSHARTPLCRF